MDAPRLISACCLASLFSALNLGAQEGVDEWSWPQTFDTGAYEIALYQPQLYEWVDFKHAKVRVAVGIKHKEVGLETFGAMTAEFDTIADFEEKVVRFGTRKITDLHFPEAKLAQERADLVKKDDDLYVGRNGNVYKRDNDGNWSKRDQGGWKSPEKIPSPGRNWNPKREDRPGVKPGQTPRIPERNRQEIAERAQDLKERNIRAVPSSLASRDANRAPSRAPTRSTYTPPRRGTPSQLGWDSRSRSRSSYQRTSRSQSSFSRTPSRSAPSRSRGGGGRRR